MENKDQPAFPLSKEMCEASEVETYPYGLTKREYFAAKAMQGIISTNEMFPSMAAMIFEERAAKMAVRMADELLKALENEQR